MGLEIIRVITTVAAVYQFMLILYGLFKDVRFGKYSLALVTSILTIYVSVGVLLFIVAKIFGV